MATTDKTVTLKMLSQENGNFDTKPARKILRKNFGETHIHRSAWEWPIKSAELKKVKILLGIGA